MSERTPSVTFILGSYTLGGAERQLASLIAHRPAFADDLDLEAITFLPTTSPEIATAFDASGVRHTLIDRSAMRFPAFFWRLVRHLARTRPAVVHTLLDSSTGAWGRLAAWLTRVPAIVHSDLSLMTEGTRAHVLLRPFLDRVTDRFLPNAEAIADRIASTGVPRERIIMLPCGVDLERFEPNGAARQAARAEWGFAEGDLVAGFLGRFVAVKRIDVLLDALLALPEASRPDHVVLAGDGPLMAEIQARVAADPWLRRACRLLGAVEDVPYFLAGIDFLVLSSAVEGLPNAVLEAMAMGRPIVATNVSDVPRIVENAGFVAPANDVDAYAAALAKMTSLTGTDRALLGARARERIREAYDLDDIAHRFWRAHVELIAPPRGQQLGT